MKTITLNQGSPAWKAWRAGGIGGSDVAAILGKSPYDDHTRATVFREKVHGIEREANFAMNRGTRLEPVARRAYELRHRCTAPPKCVEMDGCPWARVSLDGLCSDHAAINPLRWVLELKCPNWQTHDAVLEFGDVAEHFMVQVQWQMLICGLDRCDFATFNPGERFTPQDYPFWGEFESRYAKWMELPHPRSQAKRPELIDPWLDLPPAQRPPMPPQWLAEVEVRADSERQAWILEEAGRFWFEVSEARAALSAKREDTPRDTSRFEAEVI